MLQLYGGRIRWTTNSGFLQKAPALQQLLLVLHPDKNPSYLASRADAATSWVNQLRDAARRDNEQQQVQQQSQYQSAAHVQHMWQQYQHCSQQLQQHRMMMQELQQQRQYQQQQQEMQARLQAEASARQAAERRAEAAEARERRAAQQRRVQQDRAHKKRDAQRKTRRMAEQQRLQEQQREVPTDVAAAVATAVATAADRALRARLAPTTYAALTQRPGGVEFLRKLSASVERGTAPKHADAPPAFVILDGSTQVGKSAAKLAACRFAPFGTGKFVVTMGNSARDQLIASFNRLDADQVRIQSFAARQKIISQLE